LDGFFPIVQSIELKEKVLSGDKTLTIKLTEMEAKYKKEINELNKQIEDLKNEQIIFAHHPTQFGEYLKYSKNTTEFDFTRGNGFYWIGNYIDFNKLTELNKITLGDNQFTYIKSMIDMLNPSSNNAVSSSYGSYFWNSLVNIFDSLAIFLPSVTELSIIFVNGTVIPNNNLRSLPNLKKITWNKYGNTQLTTFALIKNLPNLKHLIYLNCLNIYELDQIKNWCDSKGIKLEIK
jgi:hypothetical protein